MSPHDGAPTSIAANFRHQLSQVASHWRAGSAPEAELGAAETLHQLRVALRRMRTLLTLFRPWLKRKWRRRLRSDLAWISSPLGAARDYDVLVGLTLPALAAAHPGLAEWQAVLSAARAGQHVAHQRLARARSRHRYTRFHRRMQRCVDGTASPFRSKAHPTLYHHNSRFLGRARRLLRKYYRALYPAAEHAAQLPAEERHRLRLRVKRLRYTSEALTPLLAKAARANFFSHLSACQDALGKSNDAAVAQRLLEDLPLDPPARAQVQQWLQQRIAQAMRTAEDALKQLPEPPIRQRAHR
ncbi:CHAD domain-containing protein [Pandoraea sp.]|uniref:CHAD domain-containing protein n=1 Tax=Pandoraea sp. TaxID=1883445 RepID=UPI0011F95149|nr:CHAD domain-containing protein [Pandoraea sp.]TAL55420.1 MAG: CHAD domain-containing protein [Pandoraea sp.]TAM14742.1 MAG: CHAD domain-containing protein [Pandoraea sp.]